MALTIQQKKWLDRNSADVIYGKLQQGSITMEMLSSYAAESPLFRDKLDAVMRLQASVPNPKEVSDYEHVQTLYSTAPVSSETLAALNAYLQEWQGNAAAENHVNEVRQMVEDYRCQSEFSALSEKVTQAIEAYNVSRTVPPVSLMRSIQEFISKWKDSSSASSQVNLCRQWEQHFSGMMEEIVSANWPKVVGPHGKIFNFASMRDFLETYPVSAERRSQADDLMWEWVLDQDNPLTASAQYANYWGNNGRHSAEVAALSMGRHIWEQRLSNAPLEELVSFSKTNPQSSILPLVNQRIKELKGDKLAEIRRRPNAFTHPEFMSLYNGGVYTTEELKEAAGADDELFDKILNLGRIRAALPELPEVIGTGKGESGVTDVILFGITSTGKSCVLAGLINHDTLGYDSVRFSGKYAQTVHAHAQHGFPPPPTNLNQVATIKAYITDPETRLKYNFNLFEMAGEDFRSKIANAIYENGEAATSFADMGEGAPEILRSNNDKLFFILVDPTVDIKDSMMQDQAIKALIDIMFGDVNKVNENEDVMSKVTGLHFIVTKADTMGYKGEELKKAAQEFVRNTIGTALRDKIVEGCRQFGINASDNPVLDGVPRVFPFSLGQFTVGNIFKYNPESSGNLLHVISDYSISERPAGITHKLRDFLIKPWF